MNVIIAGARSELGGILTRRRGASGAGLPLHLPRFTKPLAKVIIREEHIQQTELSMPPVAPTPGVPGWKPKFPDYRAGLDQVIESWGN